ncbi:MAG TPA: GNAT family N-acetyltransferase [Stellaceae bacterium]|nr:GNAT family N-acetyltransferase [Stellaceae bacterium]
MSELPVLRPLEASDLTGAQALSAVVAWPHRVEDWRFVHRLGVGVAAEHAGHLVGTAMGWTYGVHHAALGMVLVAPAMRGLGLGRKLTETMIDRLGERSILLNATESGAPLYARLGFRADGLVRQHQGAAFSVELVPLSAGERIRPIGRSDGAALAALDTAASGLSRGPLLDALIETADGVVLDREGEVMGFALLRRFGRGHVIGPVVAPDASSARALIAQCVASSSGGFLRIDVPEDSGLSPWLDQLGLGEAGTATPMIRGAAPRTDSAIRRFALVSQALG